VAVRGHTAGPQLIRQRESTIESDYTVDGVIEESYVRELVCADVAVIDESSVEVVTGQTVVQFADGATIEPVGRVPFVPVTLTRHLPSAHRRSPQVSDYPERHSGAQERPGRDAGQGAPAPPNWLMKAGATTTGR
jgi:hypothetical protein